MEKRIQDAYNINGILEKKSPAMLKGWQKRYFYMRDQGNMLLYYKNKPAGVDAKPQGIIQVQAIVAIVPSITPKNEFSLKLDDREVSLRATNEDERNRWVETLTFLMEYKVKERTKSMASSGSIEQSGSETSRAKNRIDWKDLDQDTMNRIKLEEERMSFSKVQQTISDKNQEVLVSKGIYPFISKYEWEVIDRYVVCGFLLKKGKVAKLTVAKKRWFFMISSVPINGEIETEVKINQSDLPSVFRLDTMYYFAYDSKGDKSNFLGSIIVDECDKPEIMNLDKNQFIEALQIQKLSYGFRVYNNKEAREYNFFCDHLTEVNQWVKALTAVLARPNKGKQRKTKKTFVRNATGQDVEQEIDVEEKEEVIIFEGSASKKHQNKLLTGPLSWKGVTLILKNSTLNWNEEKGEVANQYCLIFNITKVEGATKSFVIYMNDGEEYKFKVETQELQLEWVKKIKEQVEVLKGTINQSDLEISEETTHTHHQRVLQDSSDEEVTQFDHKFNQEDPDFVQQTYYKKMEISMNKQTGEQQTFNSFYKEWELSLKLIVFLKIVLLLYRWRWRRRGRR